MSAFIVSDYSDRIHMLTDAAQYDQHGVLTGVVSKVWKSERVPVAITGRGYRQLVEGYAQLLTGIADDAGSVDRALPHWKEQLAFMRDQHREGSFSLMIAAWSETAGPRVYSCTSDLRGSLDSQVFELTERRSGAFHMSGDVDWDRVYDTSKVRIDSPDFLVRHGVDLMEMMRRQPATLAIEHPDQKTGRYSVGGRCDLTTVTAKGVATRTLHIWPDRIGEPINPFSQEKNIVPLLNRKQRRAAAHAHRSRVA